MTTRKDTPESRHHPIREVLGSHPVGLGVGGVVGGAAAGALAGTVFGPIGTLIGAGVGVVAGAAAGTSVAERIEPHGEKEYWRREHINRPYIDADRYDFDRDYAAAYGYGLQVREQYGTRDFDASDDDLREGWDLARGDSRLEWDEAREAARDAWFRAERTYNTYDASDRYFAARFEEVTYARDGETFEDYRPAYRYGLIARTVFHDREWDEEVEQELRDGWEKNRGSSSLSWERALNGVRDAYVSTYIDYDSPFDDRLDFINSPPLGASLFRVR